MSKLNWLEIIISAIAGFLLPSIWSYIIYFLRYFNRKSIEGTWYEYHYSNPESEEICQNYRIVQNVWKIRKGIRSKYRVSSKNSELKDIQLKGYISFERNFMLIKIVPKQHEEEVYIRMLNPIPKGENSLTFGLFISLDFKGNAISSILVMSRRKLKLKEAEELLLTKKKLTNEILLSVKA